jgi:zinc transporter ZupT
MNWSFVHRWYMPFIWITLSSLISVPVAVYFQNGLTMHSAQELGLAHGSSWVMRDDFLETIVVYLLNLGALIWLFNADGSTRWAAFWASLAGLARIVAPIALASLSDVQVGGNSHYIDWQTLRIVLWFQDANMFVLGLMLWAGFARFVGETGGAAESSAHYAHA